MLSLWRSLGLGYLQRRPLRSLLVAFSIALGVATLVATQSLRRGIVLGKRDPFSLGEVVVTNGRAGISPELEREIRDAGMDGIASVHPLVIGRALAETVPPRSVMIVAADAPDADPARSLAGEGLEISLTASAEGVLGLLSGSPAVLGDAVADSVAGKPFFLRVAGVRARVSPVGRFTVTNPSHRMAGIVGNIVAMPRAAASALLYPGKTGTSTRLDISLAKGTRPEEIVRRLDGLVGGRAQVRTSVEEESLVGDVTTGMELGFTIGGIGSLVVGLFLVYNALAVSVAERRRDMGILRACGSTRSQLAGLFLVEAGLLGMAGSLAGIPLGMALAASVSGPMSQALGEALGRPLVGATWNLHPGLALAAIVGGVATAVLAALIPAFEASREEPVESLRPNPGRAGSARTWVQVAAVVSLLAFMLGMVVFRQSLPPRWGSFGGMAILLVAALLATPLMARLVGRLAEPLAALIPGVGFRLAVENLARAGGRTGLVVAAIGSTGALVVQTSGFLLTTQSAVFSWVENRVGADMFITSGSAFSSYVNSVSMDPAVISRVRGILGPDLRAVLGVRLSRVDHKGSIVYLLAAELGPDDTGAPDHLDFVREARREPGRFRKGAALASDNFVLRQGTRPGESITITGPDGPLQVPILGSYTDYTWKDGTIVVDREWYAANFKDPQIDIVDIWLTPEADREACLARLRAGLDPADGLFVLPCAALLDEVRTQLFRVNNLAYAQQAILGLVALLGVVTSLTISVLERRRELGLLRAVGATRLQIMWSVLAEAMLMGLAGGLLGLAAGWALEWYALEVMLWDEAGFRFPMLFPWAQALAMLGTSVALATLVGLWPAWRAACLDIPEAVAAE